MKLRKGTAVLWHGQNAVQIGSDHYHHTVIEGVDDAERAWLLRAALPEGGGRRSGAHPAGPPARHSLIESALRRNRFLDEGPTPPLVVGAVGLTPATIVALGALADGFALECSIEDSGLIDEDFQRFFPSMALGTLRAPSARKLLADRIPLARLHCQSQPHIAIVSGDRMIDPTRTEALTAVDTPHLLVTRGETGYEVGPLVLPGATPCHHCVESARIADDPFRLAHLRHGCGQPLGTLTASAHLAAGLLIARLVRALCTGAFDFADLPAIHIVDPDGGTAVREQARPDSSCACGIGTMPPPGESPTAPGEQPPPPAPGPVPGRRSARP